MTTPTTTQKHLALSALLAIAAITALPAQAQSITCYTVRDSTGRIIDQSTDAPIDLSHPVREQIAQKYGPGTRMTTAPVAPANCPSLTQLEIAQPGKREDRPAYHRPSTPKDPAIEAAANTEIELRRLKLIAAMKNWEPRIGDTSDYVRSASTSSQCDAFAADRKWCGGPADIRTTRTTYGKSEIWVFRGQGYKSHLLHFHNGKLAIIQE